MSGLLIRLYTDEDVDIQLARDLQRQGYDVLSCRDAGNHNQGHDDGWQLRYASSQGRAILVRNIADFIAPDTDWKARGLEHWGIIIAEQRVYIGELIRRTKLHLDTVPVNSNTICCGGYPADISAPGRCHEARPAQASNLSCHSVLPTDSDSSNDAPRAGGQADSR